MEADLEDYVVVKDTNQFVVLNGDMVLLRNKETGAIMKANYADVAKYFNLKILNPKIGNQNDKDVNNSIIEPANYDVEESSSSIEPNVTECAKTLKWTEGQTRYMLNLYAENISHIGPLKKFKRKTNMWTFMANEISNKFNITCTPLQVLTRYQCVIKRTKKAIDNNNTSGAVHKDVEYEDEIGFIVSQDDSLQPEFLLEPGKFVRNKNVTTNRVSSTITSGSLLSPDTTDIPTEDCERSPSPQLKRKTAQQKFSEDFFEFKKQSIKKNEELFREAEEAKAQRNKEKEQNKSKRHIEKLQRLDQILLRQTRLEELLLKNQK